MKMIFLWHHYKQVWKSNITGREKIWNLQKLLGLLFIIVNLIFLHLSYSFNCSMKLCVISFSNIAMNMRPKRIRHNITLPEMQAFFGILLLSGYIEFSRRRKFWENSQDTHYKLVSNAISRDKLALLWQW